jgi:hypothetical protein
MENTNPSGKSLSELIEETDKKGIKLIIIEDEGAGLKHAELIARMSKKHEIMIIGMGDLPQADQDKINQDKIIQKNKEMFAPPPIPIRNYHEHLPEIHIKRDDMNKQWYEKFAKGKKRRKF